ncbi:hypothetical protein [Cryobacterium cryoconiti]|uniref:Uncharacterized protein n=1 Tax=Cryobacterium cryoconiti TaxID=1259239 RepID=A0A4Y8JUA6_9MICO|nr:hypothetical protein [Cryobacterium cryoconiti]TFD27501.1 hypothetical protein E3T49_13245 [Cryobacterium cryoconiti]
MSRDADQPSAKVLDGINGLIYEMDVARSNGTVFTYGEVQHRLRIIGGLSLDGEASAPAASAVVAEVGPASSEALRRLTAYISLLCGMYMVISMSAIGIVAGWLTPLACLPGFLTYEGLGLIERRVGRRRRAARAAARAAARGGQS